MIILQDNIEDQLICNVILNINKNVVIFKYFFIMQKDMIIISYFNIFMNLFKKILNSQYYQKIVNNI